MHAWTAARSNSGLLVGRIAPHISAARTGSRNGAARRIGPLSKGPSAIDAPPTIRAAMTASSSDASPSFEIASGSPRAIDVSMRIDCAEDNGSDCSVPRHAGRSRTPNGSTRKPPPVPGGSRIAGRLGRPLPSPIPPNARSAPRSSCGPDSTRRPSRSSDFGLLRLVCRGRCVAPRRRVVSRQCPRRARSTQRAARIGVELDRRAHRRQRLGRQPELVERDSTARVRRGEAAMGENEVIRFDGESRQAATAFRLYVAPPLSICDVGVPDRDASIRLGLGLVDKRVQGRQRVARSVSVPIGAPAGSRAGGALSRHRVAGGGSSRDRRSSSRALHGPGRRGSGNRRDLRRPPGRPGTRPRSSRGAGSIGLRQTRRRSRRRLPRGESWRRPGHSSLGRCLGRVRAGDEGRDSTDRSSPTSSGSVSL